jgi:DNA-binding SARP family transcriptional activator/tetratricopeptide (TPR) repeat protein
VEIQLLGRFRVWLGGREVPSAAFGGRKVRLLVAVLAVHRDRHVSHDGLADALWPDAQPADPAANLGVLVNRARRALGDATLISTLPRGYALDARCVVDTEQFAEQVAVARRGAAGGSRRRALQDFRSALDGWAGEPLAEQADAAWARDYRQHLLGLRQAALEEASELATGLGEATLAVWYAEEAVRAAPLREVAAVRLAHALEVAGDPAGALDALHQLRRRLRDELGVDPSPDVSALFQQLLTRPEADQSRGVGAGRSPRDSAAPQNRDRTAQPVLAQPALTQPELPLLGREQQVDQVLAILAGAGAADGAVVEVCGPAGAGKSRFVAEVALQLGRPVLAARAYLPERAEPWSLVRSLLLAAHAQDRAITAALPRHAQGAMLDVVPQLADLRTDRPTGALDPASRRALVLEGAVRMLIAAASTGRAVIVADDVQWADLDSLLALADLVDRAPGAHLVLAYRHEEAVPGGALRATLAGIAARRDVRSVALLPLTTDDLAVVLDRPVAAAVVAGTDGLPFAVAEVVRELRRAGALVRSGGRDGRWMSAGDPATTVEQAAVLARAGRRRRLRAQVERHTAGEQEVLGLVSLLARQVSVPTLAGATAQPAAGLLQSLARLSAAGLVRLDEKGWTTSHDLVRETVVETLGDAERSRLHTLLAVALEAEAADPAELARHHAGAGDAAAAAGWYAVAAGRLIQATDGAGVAELVEAGLALTTRADTRAQLLEVRAELRFRAGDLTAARDDLRQASTCTTEPAVRSRLRSRLAMLYSGAEDLQRAESLADLAVLDAGDNRAALARALEVAAVIDMNLEQAERSQQRFTQALALYRAERDAAGTARILDGRAMATFLSGDITTAVDRFSTVAGLFTDSGDLLHVVTPLSTAGHGLVFGADPAAGLARTQAALELARSLGHREGITYALWHQAEALTALGRAGDATDCAREALQIAERIQHRGWTATALRALGIALTATGDLDDAQAAFTRSLATATGLSLFSSWAASQLALTVIRRGDLHAAAPLVDRALGEGPPLAHYEARLAHAELQHARHTPTAPAIAAQAANLAHAGGHHASIPRLEHLATAQ